MDFDTFERSRDVLALVKVNRQNLYSLGVKIDY